MGALVRLSAVTTRPRCILFANSPQSPKLCRSSARSTWSKGGFSMGPFVLLIPLPFVVLDKLLLFRDVVGGVCRHWIGTLMRG